MAITRKTPSNSVGGSRKPYVSSGLGFRASSKRVTDSYLVAALRRFNAFLKHSEYKKPYASPSYDDMETFEQPPETQGFDSAVSGAGAAPGQTPSPTPGPIPGPAPGQTPPPRYVIYDCDVLPFEFCPNGDPVQVKVVLLGNSDSVTNVNMSFEGHDGAGSFHRSGNGGMYTPSGSTSVTIKASTAHGAFCIGYGRAKSPEECGNCQGIAIGYTTTSMSVNEVQGLTVVGYVGGGTVSWSLVSGGGSIVDNGVDGAVYTAPASNPNCSLNPVIGLYCNGGLQDTLEISVNAYTDMTVSAVFTNCVEDALPTPPSAEGWCFNCYNCLGEISVYSGGGCTNSGGAICLGTNSFCADYLTYCNYHQFLPSCNDSAFAPFPYDARTPTMITQGCCPPQLL